MVLKYWDWVVLALIICPNEHSIKRLTIICDVKIDLLLRCW